MPSLFKLKSSRFRLDYTDPSDQQRYQIGTRTSDRTIANLWLSKAEELVSLVELGRLDRVGRIGNAEVFGKQKDKRYRLSEFLEKYLERARRETRLAESTLDNLTLAVDSFKDAQGDKAVTAYEVEDVALWNLAMEKRGLSKTTRSMYGRALRAAFNRGKKWKLTERNPFSDYSWPSTLETRRQNHSMSPEELVRYLELIDSNPKEHQFGVYTRLGIYTGKRRSELLALKSDDIDLENRIIRFTTLKRKEGPVISAVPMGELAYQLLSTLDLKEDKYLFKTNTRIKQYRDEGRAWTKWWVTHHTKDLMRKAGLSENYTLHSLRRAFANLLLRRDVPREVVGKLLGQASPVTIAEYDETTALDFREYSDHLDFGDPAFKNGRYRPGTVKEEKQEE